VTDRPTDRSCYSVYNNRPHLRGTVMRPNLVAVVAVVVVVTINVI